MVDKTQILLHYRIGNYEGAEDMLGQVAMKKGFVKIETTQGEGKGKNKGKK